MSAPPGKHRGIHWDSQPLGQMSDRVLADRLGVHTTSVRTARVRRGIPPFTAPSRAAGHAPTPKGDDGGAGNV